MKLFFSFLFTYSFLFSSNFEDIQKQKLSKYQFYVSTFECISSSKSSQDIIICENILKTKLYNFNKEYSYKK